MCVREGEALLVLERVREELKRDVAGKRGVPVPPSH
jgi:hypothetical protein